MENLSDLTTPALLRLHSAALIELRHRGVVRSANGPAGDYAELLFARAFGWTLLAGSSAGHDAEDAAGLRYQIKCRRLTPGPGSRQLGALRRLDERPFDVLAVLLLDEGYSVFRAGLAPVDVVLGLARYGEYANAWRLMVPDRFWLAPGVRDVTAELRAAEAAI